MTDPSSESGKEEILYDTFHKLEVLGRGGMGRVVLVRADRESEGFIPFLASAIAWDEVRRHKKIKPLRKRVAVLNQQIRKFLEKEEALMRENRKKQAELVRSDLEQFLLELRRDVEIIKKKQQEYIDKRSTVLTAADPDSMIAYIEKIGLHYPENDLFALKQVIVDDPDFRVRLHDEFRSLKLVHHPNILKVYDIGSDYYVMEYLSDTVDPESLLPKEDTVDYLYTNRDRLEIMIKTARAVEHAHMFGLIHRDIKPDNIAVDSNGNVKLIDFGLVKSAETAGMTQTGVAMGTPNYMSPEQIHKAGEASPTFDIYALGATLYHYITGQRPYRKARNITTGVDVIPKSIQEVFMLVCDPDYRPVPPSEIAGGIPAVLESITLKAMAKRQAHRYQSVRDFREDLEQYLGFLDKATMNAASFTGIQPHEIKMQVVRRDREEPPQKVVSSDTVQKPLWKVGAKAAAVCILIFIIIISYLKIVNTLEQAEDSETEQIIGGQARRAEEMYEYADRYAQEHPENYQSCMDRFWDVYKQARGTKYALMARDRAEEIRKKRESHRKRVIEKLRAEAQSLLEKKEFAKAAALYNNYDGPLAADTQRMRENAAVLIARKERSFRVSEQIRLQREAQEQREREKREAERKRAEQRRKQAELEEKRRRIRARLPGIADSFAGMITEGTYSEACRMVGEKLGGGEYDFVKEILNEMHAVGKAGQETDKALARYVSDNTGKHISLSGKNGKKTAGTLKGMENGALVMEQVYSIDGQKGRAEIRVPLASLSLKQLIGMSEADLDKQPCAMVWYLKARARKNTDLEKALFKRVKGHVLLGLLDRGPEESGLTGVIVVERGPAAGHEGQGTVRAVNLFKDGGFEQGTGNRFSAWTCEGPGRMLFREIHNPRSGRSAVRIENLDTSPNGTCRFGRNGIPVKRDAVYNLSFWMRTEDFHTSSGIAGIQIRSSTGDIIFHRKLPVLSTQTWRKYYLSFSTENTARIDAVFGVWKGERGRLWFDDAVLSADSGRGWKSLLQGESMKQAGWRCDSGPGTDGRSDFRLAGGRLYVSSDRVSRAVRQSVLGNIEVEFIFSMKGDFWGLYLIDRNQVVDVQCYKPAQGTHHARLIIRGNRAELFIDGAQVKNGRKTGVRLVHVSTKRGQRVQMQTMQGPLMQKGAVGINKDRGTSLELSTLRYRSLE